MWPTQHGAVGGYVGGMYVGKVGGKVGKVVYIGLLC